jgi:hypothetical protein
MLHPLILSTQEEFLIKILLLKGPVKKSALAGNRTRAARVAGEHSTTEPPVLSFTIVI